MRHPFTRAVALLVALPALARAQTPTSPDTAPGAGAPVTAAPTTTAPSSPPASPPPPPPLAGYQGSFFLRDPNDWFVLFPKGRLHLDSYVFPSSGNLPPGMTDNSTDDPRPKNTMFVRRGRVELQGTFARHFDFHIAGEISSVPGAGTTGTISDAYITVNYTPWAQLQIGQFDAPFTLENRTSDKSIDFMERSMVVRSFAVPSNKEIGAMVWGYAPSKVAYYSVGVFNGDGQNFKNQDNLPAVISRAFVAPLAPFAQGRRWMEELEVGTSVWWQRNVNLGGPVAGSVTGAAQNDLPTMSTQGGVPFFSASYGNGMDTSGSDVRSHLAPDGDTFKWAVEAHLPWERFGLKWELVKQSIALSRYDDTNPTNAKIMRSGPVTGASLDGFGTYVEIYAWILGGREITDAPGLELFPRLDFNRPIVQPMWALQLLARWDHVAFDISGLPQVGGADDPAQGHYAADAVQVGLNAWLTRHVRIMVNYGANFIGGFSHGDPMDPSNRDALNMKSSYFYANNAVDHELLFRLAVGL